MAPTKTIYVKESDLPLWGRFENAVKEWNAAESVSALLTEAMRHYLNQFGDQGGGLYVETPDGEPATFGGGTTAILAPQRDGWLLSLDEDEFGDSMYQGYPLGRAGVEEALKEARRCMADALKDNEVHQAARRLRDAVGEEEIIDKSVGWAAGREWALHRAVPGELDGVLELAGQHLSLIHISEPTRRTPISYAVF